MSIEFHNTRAEPHRKSNGSRTSYFRKRPTPRPTDRPTDLIRHLISRLPACNYGIDWLRYPESLSVCLAVGKSPHSCEGSSLELSHRRQQPARRAVKINGARRRRRRRRRRRSSSSESGVTDGRTRADAGAGVAHERSPMQLEPLSRARSFRPPQNVAWLPGFVTIIYEIAATGATKDVNYQQPRNSVQTRATSGATATFDA